MITTNAAKSFEARELHLKAVTVFTDRAEVQREFSMELEAGLTDIIVNVCVALYAACTLIVHFLERIRGVRQSVHTSLRKRHDHPEVELKKTRTKGAKVDSPKEQKTLKSKLASKKHLKTVYDTRLETLNNIMTSVPLHTDYAVMGTTFGSLEELFNFHADKTGQLNVLLQDVEAEIAELEPQVKDVEKQVSKARRSESTQRSIVITLESATKAKVRMELNYQVYLAMWRPSYDLRVTSDPKSPTTKRAKLHYFATIMQDTSEDWNDVDIELSTAEPRRAGSVPKLETLNATLRRSVTPPTRRRSMKFLKCSVDVDKQGAAAGASDSQDMYEALNAAEDLEGSIDEASVVLSAPTKFNEMRVQKHALSTTFKVPQKTSIPSDFSEHKVTIACLEFDLLIGLECFPSVKTDVLETASALNDSKFPLLRGPAAVYVDHKFTSETTIHTAAIGEKLVFALGVDSDVKVTYTSTEPFREQSADEKTSTSVYDKKIQIKNLKATKKILVTIHLQVPKSKDGRINRATLIDRTARAGKGRADGCRGRQHAKASRHRTSPRRNNVLHWTVELDPGKERELVVKWSVQSPANEIVEYADQARAVDRSDD